jgi:hypothetical protein
MKNSLFKIEARIELNKNGKRTWPVKSGYRPAFAFVDSNYTSGSIHLISQSELNLGETCDAEIIFHSNELLGDIKAGTKFKFFEPPHEIGNGEVLKVIGWVND